GDLPPRLPQRREPGADDLLPAVHPDARRRAHHRERLRAARLRQLRAAGLPPGGHPRHPRPRGLRRPPRHRREPHHRHRQRLAQPESESPLTTELDTEIQSAREPGSAATETAARSARTPTWRKLLRDPQAVITLVLLLTIVGLAPAPPLLAERGPKQSDLAMVNAPVGTPGCPLGADESGRDIFTRLLHSINTSVISALLGTSVALVVGVAAGLI